MKKYFLIPLTCCLIFSCSENNEAFKQTNDLEASKEFINNASSHKSGSNKRSIVDYSKENYLGQLQYLNTDANILEFSINNNLNINALDDSIGWTYFDNLYTEGLNIGEKQHLAYIILVKKDLLGSFNLSPTQEKAELIQKYTEILVETEYVGYCLLYNCLFILKSQSFVSNDIDDYKSQIANYAPNNNFHTYMIDFLDGKTDDDSQRILPKIEEDISYLSMISSL